ncbi:MAG: hypothetical protein B6244_06360 [Candidatus Cloacimonetes bacterium 4572_55]|nr:MAG: hypothetical protein B6244_06360 [Candidatus Cloacimonetes bacterium 4572_55]
MKFDRSIFINKFTNEAKEHVQKLNQGLLALEKNPGDQELIQELFRSAHTVKGSSRMMGFTLTNQVAHKMEDLLGLLREGKLTLREDHYDLLFEALDQISSLLEEIRSSSQETSSVDEIVERLDKATSGEDFRVSGGATPDIPPAEEFAPEESEKLDESEVEAEIDPTPEPLESQPDPSPSPSLPDGTQKPRKGQETIRVNMETLDQTIKSVGELIVGKMRAHRQLENLNQLKLNAKILLKTVSDMRVLWEGDGLSEPGGRIYSQMDDLLVEIETLYKQNRESLALQDTIISELEENAFQMRMLPLSTIFAAFPRAIRDIARDLGKKVELVTYGEETQLDKKMIEKLDGPLNHILRNCIDHGIEPPEERLREGKSEKGLIHLNAFNESGSVVIEVQDNGRGLDTEAIKRKAIQKQIMSEQELSKINDRDIQNFIFSPGFSTSQIITDISGRGVGLDVVRKNVEDLKGTVGVESEAGKGVSFTITLPLTLSALRVLLVRTEELVVALPVTTVRETVLIRQEDIIKIVDRDAIRLRNQIITLVNLSDALKLGASYPHEKNGNGNGNELFVVIGEVAKERVGFIIDDIIDEVEVVQKPLPPFIQKIENISGVTILGDNEIVLILYMTDLINSARRLSRRTANKNEQSIRIAEKSRPREILVVDDSLNTREVEKSIIEAHGYQVDLAKDGVDALKKIKQKSYDLIVTDVEMPKMDGFTLTQNLRSMKSYKEVPIVIVTSRERDEDKRRGISVGASAYIVKGSFDQNNLIDTIESLIG